MNVWYIAVALGLLVLFSGLLMRYFALKGLVYTRSFDRRAYYAGEQAAMIEVVRNDRPILLPWLRVESRLPASFRFGQQENLNVTGQMYHRSLFMLMPYQQITRRHRVLLTQRGEYNLGNATLTAGSLIGLQQAHAEVRLSIPVLVYPRLLPEDQVPQPFTQLLGEWVARRSLFTDPFLVSGIRGYRPGDPVRDIHWPATARMQELQVRTREPVSQARLMLLINCQQRQDQWDETMARDLPQVERAISAAATMCAMVLRQGLQAGFGTNMPTDDTRNSTLMLPAGGPSRQEELLCAMAKLRIMMTRSFISYLQELPPLQDMDVVVLSSYDSPAIRAELDRLRRQGCSAQLVLLPGQEVKESA